MPKKRKIAKLGVRYVLAALIVLGLAALTLLLSRAEAWQRLAASDQQGELRFQVWKPIAQMAWKYFPAGSGVGTFVEVYRVDEPDSVLMQAYLNHAHNDLLEVFLTAGLPGLVLLVIALICWARCTMTAFEKSARAGSRHARLGSCLVLIFFIGSIGDYPLRTPSLAALFVIAVLWLSNSFSEELGRPVRGKKDGSRNQMQIAGSGIRDSS